MRILYGVQGTGQGHISRARAMAQAFRGMNIDVTWLFSGRARAALNDMEPFGEFQHRRGLSFCTEAGRIRYRQTLLQNSLTQFVQDVAELDLRAYDFVVTDFEPVSAWAARLRGVPSIGIGHQYAFGKGSPISPGFTMSSMVMRHFAPAQRELGLHWYRYGDSVLPPILDLPRRRPMNRDEILVYLPFESQAEVTRLLREFPRQAFVQYAPNLESGRRGNVLLQASNVAGFKNHLYECRGVICNSGFELISECLQLHKPVLTKPLHRQVEQESNALALGLLDYACVVSSLTEQTIAAWLGRSQQVPQLHYPDVAAALAGWLLDGGTESVSEISCRLWQQAALSNWSTNTATSQRLVDAAA